MSNIYGAETQLLGGGFGGWGGYGGGYGCGLPAVGLFGLFGGFGNGFGHHGGHCGCGCKEGHHAEAVILDDAHYNSLQASIGGVKDNIYALGTNIGDKFAQTNYAIGQLGYQSAIAEKNIIHDIDLQTCGINHNIDKSICATNANIAQVKFELTKQLSDCCCELQKEGLKNTQVIIDKLTATEIQELRDRLRCCEKENDFFRFSANFRATTVGSNFNTGTQTQTTSNNSGQIVG